MTTTTKLSELTGAYVLDAAHTRIGFVARQAMVTKVRGHFDEFEGGTHLEATSRRSPALTSRSRRRASRPGTACATSTCAATSSTSRTTRPSPSPRPGSSKSTRPASRSPVT